jgi:resuscitation-promoting factor RpfB
MNGVIALIIVENRPVALFCYNRSRMKPKPIQWLAFSLALVGLLLIGLWVYRPVQVVVDGEIQTVRTAALNTGAVLRAAGISLNPADRVNPKSAGLLFGPDRISVQRARSAVVWANGSAIPVISTQRIAANLVALAGVHLFPGDQVLLNGQPLDPNKAIPDEASPVLQVRAASPVTLQIGSATQVIYTAANTLGEALWQAGIKLSAADAITPPLNTRLDGPLTAQIERARDLVITDLGKEIHLTSAVRQVGQALAEVGLSLQGLDFSQPAESQPVPSDGRIRLVRVQEQIILQQQEIPFKSSVQEDPNTEIDQSSVITAGIPGIQVTRIRVRSEDGQEVSRQSEAQWVARPPQDRVVGTGTKVVLHTEIVDGVTISYWRKLTFYATAYSPCDQDPCHYGTSSGLPVQHGVVAVTPAWYRWFGGQEVFIPGYGKAVIGDIGGGIPGTRWIDLGYGKGEIEEWSRNVEVYFLAPIPENVPLELP